MGHLKRLGIVVLGMLALAGCASGPPVSAIIPTNVIIPGAWPVDILVATTRERAPEAEPWLFTGARARVVSYADLTVSVPPQHQPGAVEWPGRVADPRTSFTTVSRAILTEQGFLKDIRKALSARPKADRTILVFVHGFNNRFEDALFRFTQIVHDSGFRGVPVLFTWPSAGRILDYPYDRESAVFSRDDLETLLNMLALKSGAGQIDVLAHSMGGFLFAETLRQAAIRGNGNFHGKLGALMLAAPDIDVDVFRRQLMVIGPIERPMTIFVSANDRALQLSTRFWSSQARAGDAVVADVEIVRKLEDRNIHIVDLSALSGADSLNHSKFATSPEVVQLIGRQLALGGGIPTKGADLGEGLVVLGSAIGQTVGAAAGAALAVPAAAAETLK